MRKICLFNQDSNSNLSLNLYSQLARAGKRILIIDLRFNKNKNLNSKGVELDIYNCLNENEKPNKYITNLEPNLDIIKGSSNLNFQEFNLFYEFFKFDYFEKYFKNLDYDYVIFEVSPQLNLITTNVLFNCAEIQTIIDFKKSGLDFIHKLARFTYHFNKIYSKQILISKIIPIYKKVLNKNNYISLVSEFTSKLVSYPILNSKKSKNAVTNNKICSGQFEQSSNSFKEELNKISISIIDDEKIFDDKIQNKKKQKIIQEYLDIISENSIPEKSLTKNFF